MPYYIDYYYFILIVPVLFISLICQARVNSAYSKFSRLNNMNGLTGAEDVCLIFTEYKMSV